MAETGDFELDGVTFPASEIKIEFIDPVDDTGEMFPTGNLKDTLSVPCMGEFEVTMINAGIPTIFLHASDLGFKGTEMQADINSNSEILAKLEKIRSFGAVKMGLIDDVEQAQSRQHTPKSLGLHRLPTMLHHAMMGTASVAIGTAGTIVGTIVNEVAGGKALTEVCFGRPSGTLTVGGQSECVNGKWVARKVSMSRSARRLMVGQVFVPEDGFDRLKCIQMKSA
ncbi:3-methylitaconate isomerase [Moraxella caprae]|uniref:3-methylitaconate isomerase n=1 Tax=Moraxella caprae TaxID=90240 RepID=A0A378QY81_9GAMM|nr:3-methylitaconate isomerase [Moraxella caprae]